MDPIEKEDKGNNNLLPKPKIGIIKYITLIIVWCWYLAVAYFLLIISGKAFDGGVTIKGILAVLLINVIPFLIMLKISKWHLNYNSNNQSAVHRILVFVLIVCMLGSLVISFVSLFYR